MLDVLNTVGLSDSLLRVIDRRHKLDRWLTYGGMVRHTTLCYAGPPCIHLHADKSCRVPCGAGGYVTAAHWPMVVAEAIAATV